MSKCHECAYRATIPGNIHSSCRFDFPAQGVPVPKGHPHGISRGWWFFPLNFDPVWMVGECPAFSMELDDSKVSKAPADPFTAMLALFGKRRWER